MGIHFRCHHCETELHVKDFQAGKRGRCPECRGKFRIPPTDAPHSLHPDTRLDSASEALDGASSETTQSTPAAGIGSNQSLDQVEQVEQETVPQAAESAANQPSSQATLPQEGGSGAVEELAAQKTFPQPTLPQALQSAVESQWYVRPPSGGQFGPATNPVMWQWLGENRVGRDALVWCEGWPEWLIAESVFEDYFSSVEHDSPSVANPLRTAAAATTTTAITNPSLSDRNRAERKRKRRRNYTIMIAVLTVVMLLLIGALIVVLMRQPT